MLHAQQLAHYHSLLSAAASNRSIPSMTNASNSSLASSGSSGTPSYYSMSSNIAQMAAHMRMMQDGAYGNPSPPNYYGTNSSRSPIYSAPQGGSGIMSQLRPPLSSYTSPGVPQSTILPPANSAEPLPHSSHTPGTRPLQQAPGPR
jgi:hypothetical protein